MPAFYIATEASIPYKLVSPSGARAVLNDPSDPDFCGYLDGDEALSGIDSPEVRDSFAELADTDGAAAGTNFRGRRPIVMNGRVIPTSASDRNQKLGKLQAAASAFDADGTLSWTPTGGEPVFLKYRTQLPFRAKGGFNKEFQIGLVANDPRIFTTRAITSYTETNGNSVNRDFRRFTWSSGTGVSLAARNLYLPPGTYTMYLSVKCSQAGRVIALWTGDTSGAGTTATADGNWQTVSRTFTKASSEATASAMSVYLNTALTSGNYLEVGDLRVESAAGLFPSNTATFASNWAVQAGYTASFVTANPPPGALVNPGNSVAHVRQRVIGPFTTLYPAANALNYFRITGNPVYGGSDYLVADYYLRTVIKNNTSSDYGSVLATPSSTWGGMRPDVSEAAVLYGVAGATTATRMETTFRGVWL